MMYISKTVVWKVNPIQDQIKSQENKDFGRITKCVVEMVIYRRKAQDWEHISGREKLGGLNKMRCEEQVGGTQMGRRNGESISGEWNSLSKSEISVSMGTSQRKLE